jgi:hypothetical protein
MATQTNTTGVSNPATTLFVPTLETGDCLSRDEFERRYKALPRIKKAELVDGVVFVASPVSDSHGFAHSHLNFGYSGF